jgi:signal recognition particle subunit SRP19
MVSRDENKYVIWPAYFDKSFSKNQGRKIPLKYAVDKPVLEDIAKAAKSLGLHPTVEKSCSFPSKSWKQDGRILVDKKDTKPALLLQIAKRLVKN